MDNKKLDEIWNKYKSANDGKYLYIGLFPQVVKEIIAAEDELRKEKTQDVLPAGIIYEDILLFLQRLEDLHKVARGSCSIVINSNGGFMVRTFSLRVLTSGSREELAARIAKMKEGKHD